MSNVGIGELSNQHIAFLFFSKLPHDGTGISPPVALQCNVVDITAGFGTPETRNPSKLFLWTVRER